MSNRIAHDLDTKWRSDDVITNEEKDFNCLHLDERILAGLSKAGYKIPSPVQLEAIPLCLTGSDVFVQGKAGTGKTLVFSILALTTVLEAEDLQVLIVAPTREGAFQIYNTINAIGSEVKDLKCECFIGGFSFADDIPKAEECNIAVGTPGRIGHLIHEEKLKIDTIRLFVIDDIDELLNKHMRPEVTDIFDTLPVKIQTVVTSLTCTEEVFQLASEYLKYPYLACYCKKELPLLLGMAHYYHIVPIDFLPVLAYRKKLEVLKDILLKVKFSQCIIFCNSVYRVELLCVDIQNCGLSVVSMTKAMDQVERLQAVELLRKNKCKVFITTDVGSRGLDAENVDLVVNFDMPPDSRSYLHRCGRAGRFGAKCSSITFLIEGQKSLLIELENEEHFKCYALPEPIPEDLNCDINPSKVTSLFCKPLSSGCNSGDNIVTSLSELSKKAIINLKKTRVGESYSLLTANKSEKQTVNLEIFDTKQFMPSFEAVKLENEFAEDCQVAAKIKTMETCFLLFNEKNAEFSGNLGNFSANQLDREFGHTKKFNKEHDSKNCEESLCKTAHTPYRNEAKVTVECAKEIVVGSSDLKVFSNESGILESSSKHYDSDALSTECKPLPLIESCKNLIVCSGGEASEIKTKQYLKKTEITKSCNSFDEIYLFSASSTVPESKLKIKSTCKTSKDMPHKAFDEIRLKRDKSHCKKFTRIPHVTRKKKNCNKNIGDLCNNTHTSFINSGPCGKKPPLINDHCKSQMKSHRRQVMFCGLKTTSSESDANQSCIKFYCGSPANHSDKKTVCIKCKMQSRFGKCLEGYDNHSHISYFNLQGNSFPDKKISVDGHCSCCNSRICCPSSKHCLFPHYKCQHLSLMHRDMFYQQWKFINDFSYFLSYILK